MKFLFTILLLLSCLLGYSQTWTPRPTTIDNNCGGYYEYLPINYDVNKRYPLILFLHGVGELGNGKTDLNKLGVTGLPLLIKNGGFPSTFTVNGNTYSFIVICPQFASWPGENSVANVMNYALKNYPIDTTRIYVTGLSMGGGNTWEYAGSTVETARKLAAILPICGASSPDNTRINNMATAGLPVLATHNNDDGIVTVSNTIGYVDGLNAKGVNPPAVKVIWPTGGHNAWGATYDPTNKFYNQMNAYEWMLQYKRGTSVTPPPPPALTATITAFTHPSCFGFKNGSITVTAAGGTPPYTYSWNTTPVLTTATITNLGAESYTVTVTDSKGQSVRATRILFDPAPLVLTVTPGTINVHGGTTSVTLSATGGTSPYNYSGQTTNVIAGTYSYTVIDSKGCMDTKSVTISQPPPPPNVDKRFKVYPNPFRETITIIHDPEDKAFKYIRLISMTGQIVGVWPLNQSVNQTISVKNVQPGIYTLDMGPERKKVILKL